MARKAKNPGSGTGHGVRELRERVCQECGSAFLAVRKDAPRCAQCRRKHTNASENARRRRIAEERGAWRPQTQCPQCGGPKDDQAVTCWDCIPRGGEHNANWKGGRAQHGDGYVLIRLAPDDPRRNGRKHPYLLEHLLVWEAANGPLPKAWNVHHLNGIKTDNRLENLLGLPNHEHHSHPHEAIKPYEARIRTLEDRLRAAGLPID